LVADRYAKGDVLTGGKWNRKLQLAPERVLTEPLRTKKPKTWAVWNDLFHEDVDEKWLCRVFIAMASAMRHTFMILTKRPERMKRFMQENSDATGMTPPHIWLGVTAENQEMADQRTPILLQTPATKRFVSVEPMLGPVDLKMTCIKCQHYIDAECPSTRGACIMRQKLDWVICGGESGPGARPMHPDWPRGLRDQCQAAGVPFFFKQWGSWMPVRAAGLYRNTRRIDYTDNVAMLNVGKKAAGCLLDGREWKEIPGVSR
jgi:protein gp37